ncbi:hypothetical protein NDU88_000988 [Pleurodeles waltl]|uniref:Reverse transcriptase domain-containing protein n=1 Tax=Pleurodeles waltl TaxID=8319 RepID=A0AAV7M1T3_PLEWA|nr:hypothetical protein NDU88_000988 [Pleurodeles waltl]
MQWPPPTPTTPWASDSLQNSVQELKRLVEALATARSVPSLQVTTPSPCVSQAPGSLSQNTQVEREQGVVPKKDPGQFRLIHNLSAPRGASVNEAIDPVLCSVRYASVDQALEKLRVLERGTLLAKIDIEAAFRLLPVHPEDYHLLGFQFNGDYFFDKCMPMGCSVSCSYFEQFGSA